MSCCGGKNRGCGSSGGQECSPSAVLQVPPKVMCCGMNGSVCLRIPNCQCCLPICCPPQAPQCPPPPPLCSCLPTCPTGGNGCPPTCGDSCGGPAPCCPRPAPCKPKVILTEECPKKCCPRRNRNLDVCPDQVTWPAPPKIDMCCSTSCPPRSIDICYMKVCPSPPRCCPPNFPCAAKTSLGACCPGRSAKYMGC